MGCHALLNRIFPTQGSNTCLLHYKQNSLPIEPPAKLLVPFRLLLKILVLSENILDHPPKRALSLQTSHSFPCFFFFLQHLALFILFTIFPQGFLRNTSREHHQPKYARTMPNIWSALYIYIYMLNEGTYHPQPPLLLLTRFLIFLPFFFKKSAFLKLNLFIFNLRIIALQYCVGFCQTST